MDTGLLMRRERGLGREEGRKEGRKEMATLNLQLFEALSAAGRLDECTEVPGSPERFASACREFGLTMAPSTEGAVSVSSL